MSGKRKGEKSSKNENLRQEVGHDVMSTQKIVLMAFSPKPHQEKGRVTANYVQVWFRRFRSDIFDVKDAPRTGKPVVENVDKITEIIEVDKHVSSSSITQELKIDHKTVLSHLR
ncbi:histone-lysine N-methyltransferase SETMAR [Trichonephila clavipes]|nr:histone-lysine N-methyltransferase SETMAR [Trichonephila clavipes]